MDSKINNMIESFNLNELSDSESDLELVENIKNMDKIIENNNKNNKFILSKNNYDNIYEILSSNDDISKAKKIIDDEFKSLLLYNHLLHMICYFDNIELLEYLLKTDFQQFINIIDCKKNSILRIAVDNDNFEMTKLILKHSNKHINLMNYEGTTPLMQSIYNGNYDITVLLIENSADVNIKTDENSHILHYLCMKKRNTLNNNQTNHEININKIFNFLMVNDAAKYVYEPNDDNETLLYFTCKNPHITLMLMLIKKNPSFAKQNINLIIGNDFYKTTILFEIIKHKLIEMLYMMLELIENEIIFFQNDNKETILFDIIRNNQYFELNIIINYVYKDIYKTELKELLSIKNNSGVNCIDIAIEQKNQKIIRLINEHIIVY
jgi:ankyrin repeat protein